MREQLSRWADRLRAGARVALRGGIRVETPGRSVIEGARALLGGPIGLPAIYRLHAAARGGDVAIVMGERSQTWAETDARIDRLAGGLARGHGVRASDAVVLVMHNRVEFLEAQAALGRLGASAVSVSWRSTADELVYLLDHCGARAVLVEASIAGALEEARPRLSLDDRGYLSIGARDGFTEYDEVIERAPRGRVESGEESAVVIYTSGTTGRPKGAVRKFPKDALWGLVHSLDELPIRGDDRHLVVCPLYHSTAFGFASLTMTLGGTVVIEPGFDPEGFLAAVERHQVTTTALVPTMLHRVLELPEATRRRYDTRSLRAIFSGGAPLSGALARRVISEFGHVLYNFYGATETGLNTLATPDELLRSPGTIGHVIGGNDIRLLDEEGREVAPGQTGELFVKSPMLVAGYHEDETATRASMRDGYFSVGDLAHVDAGGLYHIDGRRRDMVISGGVNVYPAEVEEVLSRHEDVAEVAVIGVPDDEWGERVVACLARRAGSDLSAEELAAWAKHRLAGPKRPREYRFLDMLPRNPTGKVLKRALRSAVTENR